VSYVDIIKPALVTMNIGFESKPMITNTSVACAMGRVHQMLTFIVGKDAIYSGYNTSQPGADWLSTVKSYIAIQEQRFLHAGYENTSLRLLEQTAALKWLSPLDREDIMDLLDFSIFEGLWLADNCGLTMKNGVLEATKKGVKDMMKGVYDPLVHTDDESTLEEEIVAAGINYADIQLPTGDYNISVCYVRRMGSIEHAKRQAVDQNVAITFACDTPLRDIVKVERTSRRKTTKGREELKKLREHRKQEEAVRKTPMPKPVYEQVEVVSDNQPGPSERRVKNPTVGEVEDEGDAPQSTDPFRDDERFSLAGKVFPGLGDAVQPKSFLKAQPGRTKRGTLEKFLVADAMKDTLVEAKTKVSERRSKLSSEELLLDLLRSQMTDKAIEAMEESGPFGVTELLNKQELWKRIAVQPEIMWVMPAELKDEEARKKVQAMRITMLKETDIVGDWPLTRVEKMIKWGDKWTGNINEEDEPYMMFVLNSEPAKKKFQPYGLSKTEANRAASFLRMRETCDMSGMTLREAARLARIHTMYCQDPWPGMTVSNIPSDKVAEICDILEKDKSEWKYSSPRQSNSMTARVETKRPNVYERAIFLEASVAAGAPLLPVPVLRDILCGTDIKRDLRAIKAILNSE